MTRHSGHTHDMEFTLELEDSDLVIDFTLDVFEQNFSDRTEVCWDFQYGNHSSIMASLLDELPETRDSSPYLHTTLRLRG